MDKTTHTIPVVELWGQLLIPLQGDIRDSQIDELKRAVLERIRDRGPRGMVIDASGVWMMDSHLCATVGKIAAAARLMGVRAVLTGLSAEVVITLQEMGIELHDVDTAIDLEAGLEKLGLRVVENRVPEKGSVENLGVQSRPNVSLEDLAAARPDA